MFKLKELSREDALHLMASQGWLELGNHLEANEELEQITPAFRVHPDVLLMRWQIYARAKQWEMCVEIGRALTELVPESPQAWVNYANSLYFDKRTQDAYDAAQQALKLHASSWALQYNLACYACQLGRMEEARALLTTAIELGPPDMKKQALEDPDLEPLWKSS